MTATNKCVLRHDLMRTIIVGVTVVTDGDDSDADALDVAVKALHTLVQLLAHLGQLVRVND